MTVPVRVLFNARTIAGVCAWIRAHASAAADAALSRSLVPIHVVASASPLFLVHPHGGTVFCYEPLARALGGTRSVFGLQAPGLDARTEPLGRIEDMAARYLDEIRAAQPDGPYAVAGWSLGGWVAFEMARRLERAGASVEFFGVFDTAFPDEATGPGPE